MLVFKHEFRETICRMHLERHDPTAFTAIMTRFTDQDQDQLLLSDFSDLLLTHQSFYDLLNSQQGFLTLQSYFIKAVLLLDRDPTLGGTCGFTSNQFQASFGN